MTDDEIERLHAENVTLRKMLGHSLDRLQRALDNEDSWQSRDRALFRMARPLLGETRRAAIHTVMETETTVLRAGISDILAAVQRAREVNRKARPYSEQLDNELVGVVIKARDLLDKTEES